MDAHQLSSLDLRRSSYLVPGYAAVYMQSSESFSCASRQKSHMLIQVLRTGSCQLVPTGVLLHAAQDFANLLCPA